MVLVEPDDWFWLNSTLVLPREYVVWEVNVVQTDGEVFEPKMPGVYPFEPDALKFIELAEVSELELVDLKVATPDVLVPAKSPTFWLVKLADPT